MLLIFDIRLCAVEPQSLRLEASVEIVAQPPDDPLEES